MSRRSLLAIAVALALIVALGAGAWAMFLRPIKVQVAHIERDVPVQVFGLGTVEARVTSRVGFKRDDGGPQPMGNVYQPDCMGSDDVEPLSPDGTGNEEKRAFLG